MASAHFPTACRHEVGAYANCQHCGRPTCVTCSPRGIDIPGLRLSLPLVFCATCKDDLAELALGVEHAADVMCRDGQHATLADVGACPSCHMLRVGAIFSATEAALSRIEAENFYGIGDVRTNAGKAAIAVARAVPLAAFHTVRGILGGAVGGGFVGAASGAIGGAALGFDAQNGAAAAAAAVVAAAKRPGRGSAAGPGAAAGTAPAPSGPSGTASNPVAPSPGSGAAEPSSDGFTHVSLDPTSSPPPAAPAPSAPRARALPMPSTPEERDADAAAELSRILSCKSAYAILGVAPGASSEELRAAYRAKSLRYHPDRNAAPRAVDVSQALNNAWAVLGDEERRRAYDASGERDTGGLDLFSGIRVTRASVAASAVGGVLGGVAGLAVGVVGGALAGVASGLYTTVTSSRAYATHVEAAGETVRRAVAARRAGLREAVAWALAHSPADAPYFGPHRVRAEVPADNGGEGGDVELRYCLVRLPQQWGPGGPQQNSGAPSSAAALRHAAAGNSSRGQLPPPRRMPALTVPEATLRAVIESGLAAAAAAAGVDVPADDNASSGGGWDDGADLRNDVPRSGHAPAAATAASGAGAGVLATRAAPPATLATAAPPPPAAARALAASLTPARPDRAWLARMLVAAEDAGVAARRSAGLPDLQPPSDPSAAPQDYDEAEEAAARAATAAAERLLSSATGGAGGGKGAAKPPTSALGLLALGRGLAVAAAAGQGSIDVLEAWVALAARYEAWSAGREVGEAVEGSGAGKGKDGAEGSVAAATGAAAAAAVAPAPPKPAAAAPAPPLRRFARVFVADCPAGWTPASAGPAVVGASAAASGPPLTMGARAAAAAAPWGAFASRLVHRVSGSTGSSSGAPAPPLPGAEPPQAAAATATFATGPAPLLWVELPGGPVELAPPAAAGRDAADAADAAQLLQEGCVRIPARSIAAALAQLPPSVGGPSAGLPISSDVPASRRLLFRLEEDAALADGANAAAASDGGAGSGNSSSSSSSSSSEVSLVSGLVASTRAAVEPRLERVATMGSGGQRRAAAASAIASAAYVARLLASSSAETLQWVPVAPAE